MNVFNLPPGARCVLCGTVLSGQVAADLHRRVFCAHHRAEGRHCRYCDSFFLPSGRSREACSPCAASQVFDLAVGQAACGAAGQWVVRHGLTLPPTVPLRFSSAMPASTMGPGVRMLGYAERRTGFPWLAPRSTVVLQAGLPLMMLRMVLGHELGHVALDSEHLRLPQWAEEGSCDWLAHRYLGEFADPAAAMYRRRIETRDDPVYGAGFRWVAARLAGRTPRDLVPLLRSTRLPSFASRP
ncbi:MAG TPA: hypothetical protein VMU81_14995 [Acetobacteraceae bacterium]|nr:hypothetical protein [Acetobacteraceae bacterium]